ncbi:hypothetical protein BVG80_03990 [Sphingobacteriales bacterium TSM_CSM]|nr:hypothetical protein BVG80_03990 [Sphingobacteriales bacterium TSM_CSM]
MPQELRRNEKTMSFSYCICLKIVKKEMNFVPIVWRHFFRRQGLMPCFTGSFYSFTQNCTIFFKIPNFF